MESCSLTKDSTDNQKLPFPYKPITKTTSSFFNVKPPIVSQGINTSNTQLSPQPSRSTRIKNKITSNQPIAKQNLRSNAFIPKAYLKIRNSITFLKRKPLEQSNIIQMQSNIPNIKYIKVSSSLPRLGNKIAEDFKKEEYYYKVEHLLRRGNNATIKNTIKKHLNNNNTKDDYDHFVKDHLTHSSFSSNTIKSFTGDDNEHDNNNKYYRMFHKHSTLNNTVNNKSLITHTQPIQSKITFTKHKCPTVKNNFKHQEQFAHFLIRKHIKHKQPQPFSPQHRSIFIILDGSIVINEVIPGFFVDIPLRSKLKSISPQERQELLVSLLNKCTELFKYPKLLCYIYTSTKQLIYDLINIQNDDLYLYVSANLTINGIKIIPHPNLVSIYKREFTSFKQFNGISTNDNTLIIGKDDEEHHYHRKHMFKTRKKTDKEKLAKLINNTFTLGEIDYDSNNEENDVYIYYSDHDSKVLNKMKQNIKEHCYLKHDFFIYLHNLDTNNKISSLYKKLKRPYHTHKAVENDYYNFKYPYDKMISRFVNETTLNPKLIKKHRSVSMQNELKSKLTTNELIQNISVYNMQNPHKKYTKVYMKRNNNKELKTLEQINGKKNSFYHQLKRNVHLRYPHFLHFNIKHFLNLYKNFNRGNLFHIFIIYKDLISLCYGMNKSELILKYGIDFNTFWKCVEDISVEKEEFVWKLFGQINKNKSGLLSMEDFFEGMSFIRNTDVREKLDLFLNALDTDGKGILSYDEVKRICKDSIKRCLNDNESTKINENENKNDNEALEELSSFFAKYIFTILKVDMNEKLNLVDVKNAIIDGSVETHYLEMFCGANKIN